jgi:hypothetical protein
VVIAEGCLLLADGDRRDAVADGTLYFTLSELESDIWVMELE